MTKAELLTMLDPYAPDEPIVFVTFQGGIFVHAEVEVSKGHGTTVTAPNGTVSMPVAIYLVDEGQRGEGRVMGMDPKDILPGGWPEPDDEPEWLGGKEAQG